MKQTTLILLASALLPSFAAAQETVTGCVSKLKHGEYVITAGQRQYRVTGGDTSALHKLDGHTVKATGAVGESDPAVQAVTPPNPGSTTGATYNTLQLQQVSNVNGNCSEHGGSTAQ
jgi:hypothetical protein